VTVNLTEGATLFANARTGTNHPGCAFNLSNVTITSANIMDPSSILSTFHVGDPGSAFGDFGYMFDIPGSGTNANRCRAAYLYYSRPGNHRNNVVGFHC